MLPVGRETFRVRSSDLEGSCDALGTADPRAQKSRAPSGTCRNHGSTKRMHSESTGPIPVWTGTVHERREGNWSGIVLGCMREGVTHVLTHF